MYALDLASGQMFYRFRDRKRGPEFLAFLRQLLSEVLGGRPSSPTVGLPIDG